jgi:deoxycytidylate deaminase
MLLRYLAQVYVDTSGTLNTVRAVALLDRAIAITVAARGEDHNDTAALLHQKAAALVKMGGTANLGAAVLLLDRVIEIKTAALGADHPSTAATLHEKANALVQMGGSANLAAAVALYDRVIEIKTAALGADHLIDSHHAAREGECVGADGWIGQPRRGGSAVRPRHRDQDGSAGSGSPIDSHHAAREGECVGADGWIGQPRRGGSAVRPRHRDQDGSAGSGSPETATTLHAKANALVQMGGSANLAAAVALYDRVIEINTAALGADHPRQPPRCTRRRMRWCRWVDRPTSPRR